MGYPSAYGIDEWVDVHGAGAQRSDPKLGDPSAYPHGDGPQGDAIRIYNYVRLVRTVKSNHSRVGQRLHRCPASCRNVGRKGDAPHTHQFKGKQNNLY